MCALSTNIANSYIIDWRNRQSRIATMRSANSEKMSGK